MEWVAEAAQGTIITTAQVTVAPIVRITYMAENFARVVDIMQEVKCVQKHFYVQLDMGLTVLKRVNVHLAQVTVGIAKVIRSTMAPVTRVHNAILLQALGGIVKTVFGMFDST